MDTRPLPADRASAVSGTWVVARDRGLADVVVSGRFVTDSGRDWTVKVDAAGLQPDRWYWYGFAVGASRSMVGRTRTLPVGTVERLRLAVFSCSNYPFGYFNSYRSAAERDDLDLALHLGDYIYEYSRQGYGGAVGARLGRQVEPPHEILSLEDYRTRYAQYRSDPDLQALHARLPMIAVWDDHEITNNTWHSGAENHTEGAEGRFVDRRQAAVQCYDEWMPIRSRPGSSKDKIYRSLDLGDLATLIMLDTRLIGRDQQLDYTTQLDGVDADDAERFRREHIDDPRRSMLGVEQEAWLKVELARSKRRGVPWQIIGQQLLVGGLTTPPMSDLLPEGASGERRRRLEFMAEHALPLNLDAWDGYGAARERFAQDVLSFADNVVVLAGDTHNSWAFDLLDRSGRQFGVELGTTSVTSPGLEGRYPPDVIAERLQRANRHLRFVNAEDRGYMVLTVTAGAHRERVGSMSTPWRRANTRERLGRHRRGQGQGGAGHRAARGRLTRRRCYLARLEPPAHGLRDQLRGLPLHEVTRVGHGSPSV